MDLFYFLFLWISCDRIQSPGVSRLVESRKMVSILLPPEEGTTTITAGEGTEEGSFKRMTISMTSWWMFRTRKTSRNWVAKTTGNNTNTKITTPTTTGGTEMAGVTTGQGGGVSNWGFRRKFLISYYFYKSKPKSKKLNRL